MESVMEDVIENVMDQAMTHELNQWGQPVGLKVEAWQPPAIPALKKIAGRYCTLEPLDPPRHAEALYEANVQDGDARWTYLFYGPFENFDHYFRWLSEAAMSDDPLFFAIIDQVSGKAVGVVSFMRIDPHSGSIEIGHLNFSSLLQQQPAATEAIYLLMQEAFMLGYRRVEWKCDSLNAPSRRAAQRFGFSYEGVFRQARIVRGRNRDTAWYAAIDREWPALQAAFETWLAGENFDASGRQKTRLSELTLPLLHSCG